MKFFLITAPREAPAFLFLSRVDVDGRSFFVKERPCSKDNEKRLQQGFEQFIALRWLSIIKFRHIAPFRPHLGVNIGEISFLVLDFVDPGKHSKIGKGSPIALSIEFGIFRAVMKLLFGIKDLMSNHMYDKENGLVHPFDPDKSNGMLPRAYSAVFRFILRKKGTDGDVIF